MLIFNYIIKNWEEVGCALKPLVPSPRDRLLRVTLVMCEVLVPLMGPFKGHYGVSTSNSTFSSLSVDILKIGSCSQTGGSVTT